MFPPMPGEASAPSDASSLTQGMDLPITGPTPEERVSQYMMQVRQLHGQIDALAGQYPEAAKDLEKSKQFLTNSMSSVAGAMTSANGMQPAGF